jgi:hypothetical protein
MQVSARDTSLNWVFFYVVPYLAQQAQDLEAAVVDLERRRAGEAVQAAPEGREEVKEDLRHGALCHFVGGRSGVRLERPFLLIRINNQSSCFRGSKNLPSGPRNPILHDGKTFDSGVKYGWTTPNVKQIQKDRGEAV